MDGYQSIDSDDEITGYRWRQLEGPPVTFGDPELPKTTFYAPEAEPYGSNLVFALKVKDKGGLKNSAKCSVFVLPQNSPPVAANDVYTTTQGAQLTISAPGILANDSDTDDHTLSAALVSSPGIGSLTLNSDGSFIYTPVDNFVGEDSFTYAANNGTMDSNTATVSITVKPKTSIIYVSQITITLNKRGSFHQARAYVIIKDDSGNIVKDAGIDGRWMKNDSVINEVSAATNGVGEAKLDSGKVKASSKDQMVFEIMNVYKQGYTYDSTKNFMNNAFVEIP
jgi:VCBS repeat-containing protein